MRKAMINVTVVAVALAIGVAATLIFDTLKKADEKVDLGEFQLSEYQREIDNCPFDRNVGDVGDPETAIKKAKDLWLEKYGEFYGDPNDPFYSKRCEFSYDPESESWLINGTLPPDWVGSLPYALIKRDGTVLAVWYG